MLTIPPWLKTAEAHLKSQEFTQRLRLAVRMGEVSSQLPVKPFNINYRTRNPGTWALADLLHQSSRETNNEKMHALWWYALVGVQVADSKLHTLVWRRKVNLRSALPAITAAADQWRSLERELMRGMFSNSENLETISAWELLSKLRLATVAAQQTQSPLAGELVLVAAVLALLEEQAQRENFVRESSANPVHHKLTLKDGSTIQIRDSREEEGPFVSVFQLGWIFTLSPAITRELQNVLDWGLRFDLAKELAHPTAKRGRG